MTYVPQIAFAILLIAAVGFFLRNAKKIRDNIMIGKSSSRSDRKPDRWKNMILLALGTFWDLRMSLVKFAAANGVWPYGYMF